MPFSEVTKASTIASTVSKLAALWLAPMIWPGP